MSSLIGKPVKAINLILRDEKLQVLSIIIDDTETNEDCIYTPYVDAKTGIALLKLNRKKRIK